LKKNGDGNNQSSATNATNAKKKKNSRSYPAVLPHLEAVFNELLQVNSYGANIVAKTGQRPHYCNFTESHDYLVSDIRDVVLTFEITRFFYNSTQKNHFLAHFKGFFDFF